MTLFVQQMTAKQRDIADEIRRTRQVLDNLLTTVNRVVALYCDKQSDLLQKIADRKAERRVFSSGVPLTELLDDILVSDADQFLLKKAYRLVASLTHPDKGGNPELFVAANLAYRSADIRFLEAVHSMLTTDRGSATIQLQRIYKARIEKLKGTMQYRITQQHLQGNTDKAALLSRELLEQYLNSI